VFPCFVTKKEQKKKKLIKRGRRWGFRGIVIKSGGEGRGSKAVEK
jgi:hypothetical protein